MYIIRLAVAVEDDNAVGIRRAAGVGWQRRQNTVGLGNLRARNFHVVSERRAAAIVGRAAPVTGGVPRFGVVNAAVINLPGADGNITVLAEQLRQRRPIGVRGAEIRAIAENARPGRIAPGEQRR